MLSHLCEFTAIVQLGATFNFGSIALSGSKSFAKSLSNYFFKVDDTIGDEFEELKYQITSDIESIQKMSPREIEEKDLKKDIDSLQYGLRVIFDKVNGELDKVKNKIAENYYPICLDNLCLFLGFYCVFELIIIVAFNINKSLIIPYSTLNILTLAVVVYFFIIEGINYKRIFIDKQEKEEQKDTVYSRLKEHKTSPFIFIIILIASFIFHWLNEFLFKKQIPYYNWFAIFNLFLGILLPFSGLLVYYIYVSFLSKKAHKCIKESIAPLKEGWQQLHKRKDDLDLILTYFYIEDIEIRSPKKNEITI